MDVSSGLVEGYRLAFVAGAVLLVLGCALVGLFIRRSDVVGIATGHEAPAVGAVA
jgi:hypothetical protein